MVSACAAAAPIRVSAAAQLNSPNLMIILRRFGSPAHWETGCRRVLFRPHIGHCFGDWLFAPCRNTKRRRMSRRFKKPMRRVLLAVLLDARRAQTGQAVLVDRILPGQEFFDRQRIAGASFFE